MRLTYKVTHLGFGFILVVIALMTALGGGLYQEIISVQHEIETRQLQSAHREIASAISGIDTDIKERAKRLARWEETRQQLANSQYYVLWRKERLQSSGLMSDAMDGIGLYDKDGKILAPDINPEALPDRLPGKAPLYFLRKWPGHYDLQYFFPIFADPGQHVLIGYGGFSFRLWEEIKHAHQFNFADPASFSLADSNDSAIDIAKLGDDIRFKLRPQQDLDQFIVIFRDGLTRLGFAALAVMIATAFLIVHLLVRPLRLLSQEIGQMHANHQLKPAHRYERASIHLEELDNVRKSLIEYQNRVSTLTGELEKTNQQLFHLAHHDALSGVFNRRAFDTDCQQLLSDSFGCYTLMLFDCDRFKDINDNYGHHVGDAVIGAIACCLQQSLRSEDRLYRLGGDEFAALLLETTPDQAEAVAKRCRLQIEQYDFHSLGLKEPVVLSTGIVMATPDLSFNEALRRADMAMYRAKSSPETDKIVFYDTSMH